ncbi:adenylate kinase 7-like [Saccoglossus kowalevskii]|uniref:Adenylate kinase 7-like n=1 Tax=Saccoglossus kowalevskii TaxID=10224 RepID=A0ABM0GWA3_SACKO|nr:PREDICTED: adenylate kinase 7-like [Saccoglossus kowalevskii]
MAEETASSEKPQSKLIFVNQLDCYGGKNIGNFLSQCLVGASLEEIEEEEDDRSVDTDILQKPKEGTFQVVGTAKDQSTQKPDWAKDVILTTERDQLLEHLMECDVIIYDITEDPDQIDEASWAVSALHAEIERFDSPKMFVLLSTVMTWAKSKPLDPDDPEIPFTEDDYRRRKPHPNYKSHISAEKLVIKLGKTDKSRFVTYVVASGLTYGAGENIFHYLTKTAWHGQAEALQCFGTGMNVVPTIHIKDLAAVLQNTIDSRPKTRYLVAVDDSQNTLEEIVRTVSTSLGTGKVKNITKEEALLSKDLEQADFDQLLVNLRMDAVYIKESMNIRWVAETGIVDNIQSIIKEYKTTRGLLPMRACILGPPAVGKTSVVQKLCEHYKLHHIKINDVIKEAIEKLEKSAARGDQDENEDDDGKAQEDQELLDQITESKDNNGGRIEDQYIIQFFREKLHSMPCQNQGFILDGYPKTYEQAKELFATDEEEEEPEGSKVPAYDKNIMPEVVISLNAPDEFLKIRVMNLPESVVADTHNTEDGLLRRLSDFRVVNEEDSTVLNYFDELEIHPDHIDATKETDPENKGIVDKIIKIMGEPRNYGPTPEELEEMERVNTEKRLQREKEEKEEREMREAEEAAERQRRQEEWAQRLEEVKRQEQEVLENQAVPLRNYLMKHVMPTLTQGLIECCKVRPDDAIDHLAEYLFKANPQVD